MQQHTENRCAARKVRDLPRRYVRRSGVSPRTLCIGATNLGWAVVSSGQVGIGEPSRCDRRTYPTGIPWTLRGVPRRVTEAVTGHPL